MNLFEIVSYYNVPIDEEQAWAICYLCGKYLQPKKMAQMPLPAGLQSINFDEEGNVAVDGNLTDDQAKVRNINLVTSAFETKMVPLLSAQFATKIATQNHLCSGLPGHLQKCFSSNKIYCQGHHFTLISKIWACFQTPF